MTRKVTLSAPQKEIIDVFAHVMVASDIDKNVEGMAGFLDSYLKETMTPKQQAIWQALLNRSTQVRKDMLKELTQEKSGA